MAACLLTKEKPIKCIEIFEFKIDLSSILMPNLAINNQTVEKSSRISITSDNHS